MKKKGLHIISIVTAAILAVASLPVEAVMADNLAADYYEMSILTQDTRKDIYHVSSLDTAEKDVTLHVGLYIESDQWPEDDYIETVSANWGASDPSRIHFTNILSLDSIQAQQDVSYSGGTYSTRYAPYCFVSTLYSAKYGYRELSRTASVTTTKSAYDPIFGAEIYQAGENQIKFTYSYYASLEDKKADLAEGVRSRMIRRECICEVQYNSEGTAYYEFSYIRQDNYEEVSTIGYLPMYDSTLAVGEIVPGMSDYMLWLYSGTKATRFFGESSDEFAMITFDIVVEQGTPDGIYSVNLLTDECRTFLSGSSSKIHMPASANGFTIVVDENAPRVTEPVVTTATETTTMTETTTTAPATTSVSVATPVTSYSSSVATTAAQTVTTVQTATRPAETPHFLESGCTLYVNETKDLELYQTGAEKVAWISDHPEIVRMDDAIENTAYLTAISPGTAIIYAVVGGKAISYSITVLSRDDSLLYGDLNQDGDIALDDMVLMTHYFVGSVKLDYYAKQNADCNEDQKVDTTDAIVLLEFLVQLLPDLPSEPV